MLGFRVWDNERKIMFPAIYKDHFMMNMDGIVYEGCPGDEENVNEELTVVDERFIPLQSTGIFDWQGKEIFEGDVLFIYTETLLLGNHYYLVESIKDFFMRLERLSGHIVKISNDGNIYENPSLLTRLEK